MEEKEISPISLNEVSADIRNKLQTARTALELLKQNKTVPQEYLNKAIEDLEKIVKIIS